MEFLSFGEIKIKPFEFQAILEIVINEKVNEHSLLSFRGVLSEEKKDTYINEIKSDTKISLVTTDSEGNETIIFNGKTTDLKIESKGNVFQLVGEAISYTQDLDIKIQQRSFQDKNIAIKDLFTKLLSDYDKAYFVDNSLKGKTTGKFVIQYNETDWEFMKRMASRVNMPLFPIIINESPSFQVGPATDGVVTTIDNINYSMGKNIEEFKKIKENSISDMSETDFEYYEIFSEKILTLGAKISFKEKEFYVYQSEISLKEGLMKGKYRIISDKGIRVSEKFNTQLAGCSLEGRVLAVSGDSLKIHLAIDDDQDENVANWFKQTTTYSGNGETGWHCMPEKNDNVRVYFPTHKDEDAVVVDSVRRSSGGGGGSGGASGGSSGGGQSKDKLSDPNTTYFRTPSGKELKFDPNGILISGKDGAVYIDISDPNGIQIISDTVVKVNSKENISLIADKSIIISALEKIELTCKSSKITMTDNVELTGQNIKLNE